MEECTSIYISTCRICFSEKVDAAPYLLRLREACLLLKFPMDGSLLQWTSKRDKDTLIAYGVIEPPTSLCIPAHEMKDEEMEMMDEVEQMEADV